MRVTQGLGSTTGSTDSLADIVDSNSALMAN
jgi:hypothetical protein